MSLVSKLHEFLEWCSDNAEPDLYWAPSTGICRYNSGRRLDAGANLQATDGRALSVGRTAEFPRVIVAFPQISR